MTNREFRRTIKHAVEAIRNKRKLSWTIADMVATIPPARYREFADEIKKLTGKDYAQKTLARMASISRAWPKAHRSKASFSVHHHLSSLPNRFDLIHDTMTTHEARAIAGAQVRNREWGYDSRADTLASLRAAASWMRCGLKRMDPDDKDREEYAELCAEALVDISFLQEIYEERLEMLEEVPIDV